MKVSSCVQIIILAIFACSTWNTVKCEITVLPEVLYYNITTTPRADLYQLHHQRHFTANANEMEQILVHFKIKYNSQLDVLALHMNVIETKLDEVNKGLDPLVLLGDVNDYCVHKYRSKLPAIVQLLAKMKDCNQKGVNAYNGIVSGADTTLRNLKTYYTSTFASATADCRKRFAKQLNDKEYMNCVSGVVKTTVAKTINDRAVFDNQLMAADCTASLKMKEVFDCYSSHVFSTYKTIGEVMGLVENCIAGHEFCPSCGDEEALTKGRCPYHMSWHLADDDLKSEKITNPFKGVTKTTPCLQVNFITKGITVV